MEEASAFGKAYRRIYDLLAGQHPHQRLWHFQWSSVAVLHNRIRHLAPSLRGSVLDVGCGSKPYEAWFQNVSRYVGLDVDQSGSADVIVEQSSVYPFQDGEFDTVIAFEVLEHVEDIDHVLSEIFRVLRPGGRAIFSVPFLYNEHGAPGDFRRLTRHSAPDLAARAGTAINLANVETIGGIGSTTAVLVLNWIEVSINQHRVTRIAKGILLPAWLVLSLVSNLMGRLFDYFDTTSSFYHHVVMTYEKPASTRIHVDG